MSDEGLINLENDGPADLSSAVVSQEAQDVLAADRTALDVSAPKPPEPEPEANLDAQGLLSALRQERQARKELSAQAQRAGELEAQLRELQPYAEFVKNNRDLLIQRQPEPVAPAAPEVDQDAVEMAQLLDFYKPDGSLDVDRGKKALNTLERRATKIADQRVAPIIERTAHEQAQINYQRAAQVKDANGESASQEALQAIFRQMDPRLAADPAVAQILTLAAMGADRMRTPRKTVVAPPVSAPALSESSGGHPQTRPTMSRFEESVAKERGIAPAKWQEHTKGFVPGRASALED